MYRACTSCFVNSKVAHKLVNVLWQSVSLSTDMLKKLAIPSPWQHFVCLISNNLYILRKLWVLLTCLFCHLVKLWVHFCRFTNCQAQRCHCWRNCLLLQCWTLENRLRARCIPAPCQLSWPSAICCFRDFDCILNQPGCSTLLASWFYRW